MSRHLLRPKTKRLIHARARTAVAWQTNGTWTINGVNMKNTPTIGSELLTNGDLETWTTSTNAGTWTESITGSSTVNQETSVIHGGSNAARLDVDSGGSSVFISQTVATIGKWYQFVAWMKNSTTGKSANLGSTNFPWGAAFAINLTTSYVQYTVTGRAAGTGVVISRLSAASSSIYIDDVSFKELTHNTIYAVRTGVSLPASVVATGTIVAGAWAGVVYGLDSISSPTNAIIAIHDGVNNIKLEKMVAGVWTTLIATTATYAAGFLPQIKWISANTFGLFYKGVQAGTNQTVSDAGTGTLHGVISLSPLNAITGVFVS